MTSNATSREALLNPDVKKPPEIRCKPVSGLASSVIDAATFNTIEVDKLFDSINHAVTQTGQAVLYRDLVHPLADAESVRQRHDAIRELEGTEALTKSIETLVEKAKVTEPHFYNLLYGSFMGLIGSTSHKWEIEGYGYETYIRGTRFLLQLVENAGTIKEVQSPYLKSLLGTLQNFAETRSYALAKGPVYRTEKGIITAAEKKWYTPAIRFQPGLFKPVMLLAAVGLAGLAAMFVPVLLDMVGTISPVVWLFLMPLSLLYIPIVGGLDRDGCIYPIRDEFRKSPDIEKVLNALGQLDELLSFIQLRKNYGHTMALPEIREADNHSLSLQSVRNPILGKQNPAYVPNDLDMSKERLSLITGPNSGGKTAFCKTLAQTQLLAQIGGYVPAVKAELTVADHIFYQVPEISQLSDGEGRFGTELRHTKSIFLAASPKSLVIMDELSEGTTHEEKIEISMNILEGFQQKGNSTILITHNHDLVDRFMEKGTGLARQVEFANDQPTYRLVEGISRVSHADRVAKKIGFSKEDISRYLSGDQHNTGA